MRGEVRPAAAEKASLIASRPDLEAHVDDDRTDAGLFPPMRPMQRRPSARSLSSLSEDDNKQAKTRRLPAAPYVQIAQPPSVL